MTDLRSNQEDNLKIAKMLREDAAKRKSNIAFYVTVAIAIVIIVATLSIIELGQRGRPRPSGEETQEIEVVEVSANQSVRLSAGAAEVF